MLTWPVVILLAVGVYGQRALGAAVVDAERLGPRARAVLGSLPLAIISAVIALQTLTASRELVADTRLVGLGVAALCAWRRLPLLVTVLAAAAATALVRRLGA